jgi:hypothetical protein
MKKLLLASVLAIASIPSYAHAADTNIGMCEKDEECAAECLKDAKSKQEIADCKAIVEPSPEECHAPGDNCIRDSHGRWHRPSARVIVRPPYQGPPPIGWVYGPYTQCGNPPQCSMGIVTVDASGLNVRTVPNGYPIMALVNGTVFYPLQRQGDWLLVAPACDLTPTWAWSWNAGVPLNRCWVYF